ncbi:sodium:solute symporter family protein [Sedimentibacter saalensis]|jgi:SSS family solute:Na+ symporter|uniref:SSS family solute:Na+ symporter n=2 Tax=root TaxID=1 RepID=A0A562JEE4_9FIRM|nr:sodium:solute symporter family protein [Sedimentibacter saalensis]MEA5094769.1 sodium:solute symporter family protein [Sedimentibacter saalensis]TWH81393.1 SSS family solute:Na+ symporter [Sedimentibacter saalensis]
MTLGTTLWIITVLMCGAFLGISLKVKDKAELSFSNYAIGGKTFPMYLIFFTQFATIMGVGNFVGHAGSGYSTGLSWMAFILGEQGSKIIFALFIAGFAGRFTYNTFPELLDDLITKDKVTRAMAGVLASSIMIAWVGGQGKALGNIFSVVTGVDPLPVILLFSAVFIIYTTLGGIYSVVWTDLLQGVLVLIFGVIFYVYAFKEVNFSVGEIGVRLQALGRADMWEFGISDPMKIINMIVTGTIGILVAQIYWQRCFSATDTKTAKNGMLYSGIIAILAVMLTALVGMIIFTIKQDLAPGDAMAWFMMNRIPVAVAGMVFALVLAAGMSSADSNLNSASILIVNDLIKPFKPETTDQQLVKYAKWLTAVIGVFAALGAIYASSILSLFSRAYSMAGSGLVPLLVIGLLWKEKPDAHEKGKKNSKVTPWGARVSIVAGAVLSQINALGSNKVLIALAVSAILLVVVSLATQKTNKQMEA